MRRSRNPGSRSVPPPRRDDRRARRAREAATTAALAAAILAGPVAHAAVPADSEHYRIQPGDTLSAISQRLFGDAKYWPRLHSWNQASIRDPHLIRPGNWITFFAGSTSMLPSVSVVADRARGAPRPLNDRITSSAARARFRSEEWKKLPPQAWEQVIPKLPSNVDYLGFDKSNKIFFKQPRGMELDAIAVGEKLPPLGQIVAGRIGAQYLTLGDTVYIRPDSDELKIGETYSITREPYRLKSSKSDRSGYSYLILGQVKLVAARDDLFVGTITEGKNLIARGSELIATPARVERIGPIPGPSAVEGRLLLDKNLAIYTTAQHHQVHVNRGSSDGIKPGMVFRCYEHYDPHNDKRITSTDFIVEGDVMVVQVSETFSTAIVLNSESTIFEDAPVTLLMDVSDLRRKYGFADVVSGEKQPSNELDELDGVGGALGPDERKELEQLERWKGNPENSETAGQTPPEAAPAPEPPAPEPSATPAPPEDPLPPTPAAPETEPTPRETAPPTSDPSKDTHELDKLLDQ